MRAVAVLVLALGAAPAASAQELSAYTGLYVGSFDHENPRPSAFTDSVSSWKVYGGVQLGDHFGFEVAHGSTGEFDGGPSGSPLNVGVRMFNTAHSVQFGLTTFRAMGILPLRWGAVWLAYGGYLMDADVEFTSATIGRASLTEDHEDQTAALGVERRFDRLGRSIDVRLEYEWFDFPFSDASTVGVGVAYRFKGL